jgi:hypothetical protein
MRLHAPYHSCSKAVCSFPAARATGAAVVAAAGVQGYQHSMTAISDTVA